MFRPLPKFVSRNAKRRRRDRHRSRGKRTRQSRFELLEDRRVLDGTAGPEGGSPPTETETVGREAILVTLTEGEEASGLDYGDAPEPYPTTAASDGARHVASGPRLGPTRDTETDGSPSAAADADGDDEDGVRFGPLFVGAMNREVFVEVVGGPARLDAWIDFDGDGSWGGPGERVFRAVAVEEGESRLGFAVPNWAASGSTQTRFRLSTAGGLGVSGAAEDGEVEDHTLLIHPPVATDGLFGPHETITSNADNATDVHAADLDGDGDLDVLSTSYVDRKLSWHRNDGNGSFEESLIHFAGSKRSVTAEDIDGDGDLDILASWWGRVVWFENRGANAFGWLRWRERTVSTSVRNVHEAVAVDVDGDGDIDVVSASGNGTGILWHENDGTQKFTSHIVSSSPESTLDVAVADADRDGDIDIFSPSYDGGTVTWYENLGEGKFTTNVIASGLVEPEAIRAADLDADGQVDVITASQADADNQRRVLWLQNRGDGAFVSHLIGNHSPGDVRDLDVADLDGDGDFDVLAAESLNNNVVWYENAGGSWLSRTISRQAHWASAVFAADLDRDGDLDVLSASGWHDRIDWYQNLAPDPADLSVDSLTVGPDATAGDSLKVTWTVTNRGEGPFSGSFVDRVFLSPDSTTGNAETSVSLPFSGTLEAGETVTRTHELSLDFDVRGSYYVIVMTDADEEHVEPYSESNNTRVSASVVEIVPAPYANLRVATVSAPPVALAGSEILVDWLVTNHGTGPTDSTGWVDGVWLSRDGVLDPADTFLGEADNTSYLPAGQSYTNSLTVSLPAEIDGDYRLIVRTDHRREVLEREGEDDNDRTSSPVALELPPVPDLQVSGLQVQRPTFFSGSVIDVSWRVQNAGAAATREDVWFDEVYLRDHNPDPQADRYLGRFRRRGVLGVGDGYDSAVLSVRIPVDLQGNYSIVVRTDAEDLVEERGFEGNNEANQPVEILLTPPPDLEVTSVQTSPGAVAGHPISIEFAVTNNGSSPPTISRWSNAFYLSNDARFDRDEDLFLGTSWLNLSDVGGRSADQQLGPGQVVTIDVAPTLPNDLRGEYFLFVWTDPDNRVFELDTENNVSRPVPLSIVSQPADLVVETVAVSSAAEAGAALPVRWAVRNQGVGDTIATSWVDRVYLSSDGVFDPESDRLLGSFRYTHRDGGGDRLALDSGGGYDRRELVSIPFDVEGPIALFVQTDAEETVHEGERESNNSSSAMTLEVARALPDLEVISVTTEAVAGASGPLTVSWSVRNTGTGVTNVAAWEDALFLSSDESLDAADIPLGAFTHSGILAAGETYTATRVLQIPANLSGEFYLLARVDRSGSVYEGDLQTNNVGATASPTDIQLNAVPDLLVSDVQAPGTAISGQRFDLHWTVTNVGAMSSERRWDDHVYLSLDTIFDPNSDLYIGYQTQQRELTAGESYTGTGSFRIPAGRTGDWFVFVVSDGGKLVNERAGEGQSNIGHDTEAMRVRLLPPSDFVVGAITIPEKSRPGESVEATYRVTNEGPGNAEGAWNDALYLSRDATWSLDDVLLGRYQHSPLGTMLEAGASYQGTVRGSLPALLPGTYHVIVRTDIHNAIAESTEWNNVGASLERVEITVPELIPAIPSGGILSSGRSLLYRLEVPMERAGEAIVVQLEVDDPQTANELYARFGDAPTRSDYEFRHQQALSANQRLVIPRALPGTYYLLIFGDPQRPVDAAAADYSILADYARFDVFNENFGRGGTGGRRTVRIDGVRFDGSVKAALLAEDGEQFEAIRYRRDGGTRLYATFDLTDRAPGSYAVAVTKASTGESRRIEAGFEVVFSAPDAVAAADIDVPRAVRRPVIAPSLSFPFRVSAYNDSLNDQAIPLLMLDSSEPFAMDVETLFGSGGTQRRPIYLGIDSAIPGLLMPGEAVTQTLFTRNTPRGQSREDIHYTLDRPQLSDSDAIDWETLRPWVEPLLGDGLSFEQLVAFAASSAGSSFASSMSWLAQYASGELDRRVDAAEAFSDLFRTLAREATLTGEGSIRGVVVAERFFLAPEGLAVTARHLSSGRRYMTQTDSSGNFAFLGIPPGQYEFGSLGALLTGTVELVEGETTTATLRATLGTTLMVTVHDERGTPLDGVTISISDEGIDSRMQRQTTRPGEYRLSPLPVGAFGLSLRKDGFTTETRPIAIDDEAPEQAIVVTMRREGVIRGTLDLEAPGIDPTAFRITLLAEGASVAVGNVDAAGAFEVAGPSSADTVRIEHPGFGARELAVTDALRDIRLQRFGRMSVSVRTTFGERPTRGRLQIEALGHDLRRVADLGDLDGSDIEFADLPPGRYRVAWVADGITGASDDVEVASGATAAVELIQSVAGSIFGRLPASWSGGLVELWTAPGDFVAGVDTAAGEAFRFDVSHAGTYRLTYRSSAYHYTDQEVTIGDGEQATLPPPSAATGTLRGIVRSSDDSVPVDAFVVLRPSVNHWDAPSALRLPMADDGTYAFPAVLPGRYVLHATDATGAFSQVHELDLSGDDLGPALQLREGASIELTVTSENAVPIPLARIRLVDQEAFDSRVVYSDEGGRMEATRVPAGRHRIEIIADGFQTWTGDVDLAAGELHADEVRLSNADGTALQIEVRDDKGQALEGVTVSFFSDAGVLVSATETGADGIAQWVGRADGPLTVVAGAYHARTTVDPRTSTVGVAATLVVPAVGTGSIIAETVEVSAKSGLAARTTAPPPEVAAFGLSGLLGDRGGFLYDLFNPPEEPDLEIPEKHEDDDCWDDDAWNRLQQTVREMEVAYRDAQLRHDYFEWGTLHEAIPVVLSILEGIRDAALDVASGGRYTYVISALSDAQQVVDELLSGDPVKAVLRAVKTIAGASQTAVKEASSVLFDVAFFSTEPAKAAEQLAGIANSFVSVLLDVAEQQRALHRQWRQLLGGIPGMDDSITAAKRRIALRKLSGALGAMELFAKHLGNIQAIIENGRNAIDKMQQYHAVFVEAFEQYEESVKKVEGQIEIYEQRLNEREPIAYDDSYRVKVGETLSRNVVDNDYGFTCGEFSTRIEFYPDLGTLLSTTATGAFTFAAGDTPGRTSFQYEILGPDQNGSIRSYSTGVAAIEITKPDDGGDGDGEGNGDGGGSGPSSCPSSEDCETTRDEGSLDPNDIIGPQGAGPERFVSANAELGYTIRFENDALLANAPAQVVEIRQQLDEDLDVRSFRLGTLGFGPFHTDAAEGLPAFQGRFDFVNQAGVLLDVIAGIDIAAREAFWSLKSIDPETGDAPSDPRVGFLPPNIDGTQGQGFVSYTVKPDSEAQTGDVIDAEARIVFDINPPIDTPPIFNTLDAAPPSSSILFLSDSPEESTFPVSWAGDDADGGSGVASYTVFVSVDGGPFLPWISDTELRAAPFQGEPDTTYAFYSVARDASGNVEEAPAVADAVTETPDLLPPQLVARQIQPDRVSRSHVNQVTFDFSESVNFDQLISENRIASAVTLMHLGTGDLPGTETPVPLSAEQFEFARPATGDPWRLTWSLEEENLNTSLEDGLYQWRFDAGVILDAAGNRLDGNGDGEGGDDLIVPFHRLFGDVNGDRRVDLGDRQLVDRALGSHPHSDRWTAGADLDLDGRVTVRDRVLVARSDGGLIGPKAARRPSQTASTNYDISGDGRISAQDALLVINVLHEIDRLGRADNSNTPALPLSPSLDVNRDGKVSALDALSIVNQLHRNEQAIDRDTQPARGEGEFAASPGFGLLTDAAIEEVDLSEALPAQTLGLLDQLAFDIASTEKPRRHPNR